MTQVVETLDVGREWSRLRSILRFAILCGDVIEEGNNWAEWGPGGTAEGSVRGVDRERRVEYWDVLKALYRLRSNDPFGHELLRRHVGYHCEGTRCANRQGAVHWHSIGLTDLCSRGHTREDLAARREGAMGYVVQRCQ